MKTLKGVIAATATPLNADLSIDVERLIGHCRWLLGEGGCDGINLLGTTGEATSFSVAERIAAMRAVAQSGLPLNRMMVGTGASALADAVALTRTAREFAFAGALLLPPFYYKGIDAESLANHVGEVIAKAGPFGLRIYLYHIPQNTGVPFGSETIARLRERYPDIVVGLKDSSGDIAFSRSLAVQFPGFDVFPSSEGSLAEWRSSRFAGCISATTNVTGALSQIVWSDPEGEKGRQAAASAMAIRGLLGGFPLMASVKAALAAMTGYAGWERLMPPLRRLSPSERAELFARLDKTDFAALRAPAAG
ncbi:dihydrodipicolinate synthase family protein [Mesorhizobium sp. 131-2-1]|uniref:dihydrodipicolinate synthase family protein n=1 Tax=Mesorhizobium sp. 131-2-1 TaxID=2744518 RepID=UPI001925EB62|nr:dihydrodipicolinate synthase family protein [Mesorhizobium sp. 131-2-1]BCG95444.1 dihydrodipicolinate synthase family protein [Mesorhizobium sp. 131-2-1]